MNRTTDVVTSALASGLTLGVGGCVTDVARQPEKPLKLYEFETCPFCRKAREALSAFDLDALILPCPPGGQRFRSEAERIGGKQQFPLLIDDNTQRTMYESDQITRYLADEYGAGSLPLGLRGGPLASLRAGLGSLLRAGQVKARRSRAPEQPLVLYNYEASPFCRLVREALSSLELWHTQINLAKGSQKRDAFIARSGKMMVPFLVDPNTETSLFESADIVAYLERTYAL